MKTKLLMLILMIGLTSNKLMSQNIPNPDFENLDTLGYPAGWSGSGYGNFSSPNAHSGSNSMSVWNWYYYGYGFAVNGYADAWTYAYKGGTPFNQKATQLNGYYRYDTTGTYSNHDSAEVAVILKKYNTITQQVDTIGYGFVHLPAHLPGDGTFAPFSVDIIDWDPSQQPDSIVVGLKSSINGFCETSGLGECLYFNVDLLSLVTPLGITDVAGNFLKTEIYPNPSDGDATLKIVSENFTENASIIINDVAGKCIESKYISLAKGENSFQLQNSNYDSGLYFVTIKSGDKMETLRMVKN